METKLWKVGALARATGLSIRTLHYYDEIGLLEPSHKTDSGHRLYAAGDIQRLQQIKSLRQLGFPLDEIRDLLGRPDFSPLRVVRLHLARLHEQMDLQRRLCLRLEAIAAALDRAEEISVERLLETIEAMNMFEQYFTKEQLTLLREREQTVGHDRIREVEAEWPRLIAEVRKEMEQGTDPSSPVVRALARRWNALVLEFTGGDNGLERAVGKMYQQEASVGARTGLDMAVFEYISKAAAKG